MKATDNQTLTTAVAGLALGRWIDLEATTGGTVVWRAGDDHRLRAPS